MPDHHIDKQSPTYLFAEIKTILNEVKTKQDEHHTEFVKKFADHDKEIGELKKFKWMTLGVVACIEFFHQLVERAHGAVQSAIDTINK